VPAIAVDHVQFSVPELAAGVRFLETRGWTLQFTEPSFVTTERSYFRSREKSMAYLRREGVAIELIDGSDHQGLFGWTPVFSTRLPGAPCKGPAAGSTTAEAVHVEELGTRCLCLDDSAEPALEGVILETSDVPGSAKFLESLGFQREPAADPVQLVFPSSFIGMPLRVTLAARAATPARESYVDDLGMSLVALISKSLEQDLESLRVAGHNTTEISDYTINGRRITNAISRGPGGELVELIELGRA
jgi:hypothetical protein